MSTPGTFLSFLGVSGVDTESSEWTRSLPNTYLLLGTNYISQISRKRSPRSSRKTKNGSISMVGFSSARTSLGKLVVCARFYSSNKAVSYVQGQSPRKNLREYFYFVDHQGMLFLDDSKMKNFTSCFKDKEFLVFFFKRIRPNETDRYSEFPYISLCGRERNYIRCDDTPLVFTHIKPASDLPDKDIFCYGHAGDLMHLPFQPDRLFMSPVSGRVYHPCEERFGSVGLVMSKLAIELSTRFSFENGESSPPTKFQWKDRIHKLDNEWYFKYRTEDGCKNLVN